MKILNTEQMVESLQEVINFIECKVEDPHPDIIARQTTDRLWADSVDLKFRLDQLSERVTKQDEYRYQQTRSCRDDMLSEFNTVGWQLIGLTVALAVTVLALVYHIYGSH